MGQARRPRHRRRGLPAPGPPHERDRRLSTISTQTLTVRYYAGAAAAAGREEETFEVPAGATVQQLAELLGHRHGPALLPVLAVSSFLVDAVRTDRAAALPEQARQLDVLPPFAGG